MVYGHNHFHLHVFFYSNALGILVKLAFHHQYFNLKLNISKSPLRLQEHINLKCYILIDFAED